VGLDLGALRKLVVGIRYDGVVVVAVDADAPSTLAALLQQDGIPGVVTDAPALGGALPGASLKTAEAPFVVVVIVFAFALVALRQLEGESLAGLLHVSELAQGQPRPPFFLRRVVVAVEGVSNEGFRVEGDTFGLPDHQRTDVHRRGRDVVEGTLEGRRLCGNNHGRHRKI